MRTVILLVLVLHCIAGFSQVTTNASSGLAANYPSLASAISALNGATITAPVIITINGNETVPPGGLIINAQGTAVNTIKINGNQFVISGSSQNTPGLFNDAIIKLVGADFVTLENFILQENPLATNASAATNTVTEWGIALLAASLTNGSQNNTIQNNTISLRVSAVDRNTFGIYSNVAHSATSISSGGNPTIFSGTNSNNKVYGNKISKISVGIAFIGAGIPANPDLNNEIGGTTASIGNSITEWGHSNTQALYTEATALKCAIRINSQINETVSFNNIISNYMTNSTNGTVITAISKTNTYINPAGITNITNNTITIKALDHFLSGIDCSGTTQNDMTLNITNNKLLKWTLNRTNTAVGIVGIYNGISVNILNITDNLIRGINSQQTNGTFTGIENQGTVVSAINISNNKLGNEESPLVTFNGITSITNLIRNTNGRTSCILTISGNEFNRIVYLSPVAHSLNFITLSTSSSEIQTRNINQNVFKNMNINMTGPVTFFNLSSNIPANGILNVNNNSIQGNFIRSGASGDIKILDTGSGFSAGANTVVNINSNNFSNITTSGTSLMTGISYNLGQSITISGNTMSNWSLGGVSSQGNLTISVPSANSLIIQQNIISNIITPFAFIAISTSFCDISMAMNSNQINNITSGTNLWGIITGPSAPSMEISNNNINNLVSTNGTVVGIDGSVNNGNTTSNIYKNKIFDLQTNSTTLTVTGLVVGKTSTNNGPTFIYNNYIGNLKAPNSNVDNAVRAVNYSGSSNASDYNFYYNTFYLDAVSTGTNFGSSIFSNTIGGGFTRLDLRNNIFVNTSVCNGNGLAVILRGTAFTISNYKATCNHNLFYAGTPGAQRLIYYNSVSVNDQTLAGFQARVYPRENKSVTELPSFLSLDGTSPNFLHINPAVATQVESGGIQISGYPSDFDGTVRAGFMGYAGTGILPDIGADEGEFLILDNTGPNISFSLLENTASLSNRNFNNVSITDVSGVNNTTGFKPRVYYKKKTQTNTFNDNTNASDGWKYAEATGNISPFDFAMDYSLLLGGTVSVGDTIQYFVIAQDLAPTPNVGLESGLLTLSASSVSLDASHFPLINTINFYVVKTGIEGTKTVCSSGCDFVSLTNAGGIFEAINNSLVTDNLIIHISGDLTTELGTFALNQYNVDKTILIRPAGGQTRTISGTAANGKPLIDLNGADFVTIDGINAGGDSLTIANLSTSSSTQTSTIRFTNGASNNTLIRCRILGSHTVSLSSYGGVILFNTSVDGNVNNTIQNCDIGPAGVNLPVSLITSMSNKVAPGNTVANNNLYDFFSATKSSSGIYFENNSGTSWTISGNKFFQTSARTFTTTDFNYHYCIRVSGGDNHIIQNNIIGYSNASGSGTYSIIGITNSSFVPMDLWLGSNYSSIQGNKISNLSFTGTSLGEMTLMTVRGFANIGTILPNVFGDTLTNANIVYTRNSSSSGSCTIVSLSQSFTDVVFKNNVIGGILASNIGTGGCTFNAVSCNNSVKAEISDNIIGGNAAHSLLCTSPSTSTMAGISFTSNVSGLLNNNIIKNISASSIVTSNVYGIDLSNTTTASIITRNRVFILSGLGASGSGVISGIRLNTNTITASTIDANFIHSLIPEAPAKSAIGINITNGRNNITNNMIRGGLKDDGTSITLPCLIYGILENAGVNKINHNSILIAGNNVTNGTAVSAAIRRVLGTSDEIRNNIFSNQRFNASTGGSHYNIYFDAITNTPVTNKNIYYNTGGNGNLFGRRQSTDFTSLTTWRTSLLKDVNSYFEDPVFTSPMSNAINLDLHILTNGNSIAHNNGDPIQGLTTDFDGQTRSLTTPDIGADEGDFVSPVIAYTSLGNFKPTNTRTLTNVAISAQNGVNNSTGLKPRVYFKKKTDANDQTGWKFTETTSSVSPYSFTIDYTLLNASSAAVGDTIQYFVVAQDLSMPSRAAIENGFTNSVSSTVNLEPTHFPISGNINSFAVLDSLSGNYTVCNSGCNFTSLTNNGGLFNVINNSIFTGNVIVSILSDLTSESGTHSLNQFAAGFTLTIEPSGGVMRTISGTVTNKGLIALAGADNVIIDGLNTGGNGLTIINPSTSNTTYTSTIEMRSDANNNIVRNCTILGSTLGGNSGVIAITFGDKITGNDNNIIRKCTIGPAGANLPLTGVLVNGISGTVINNNNVVDSNLIYDYFGPSTTSNGILVGNLTTNTIIANNRFYQSASRIQTAGIIHHAINIANGTSTITDNIIGGSNSNNGGTYDIAGTNSFARFYPIYVNASSGDTTRVSNNTIKNLSVSGNRSGVATNSPFTCIYINTGLVQNNNNTIGDMQNASNITYTSSSTSASDIMGIYNVSQFNAFTNNNVLGSITVTNSSTGATNFYGIRVENTLVEYSWNCLNNQIGGSHPQSIQNNASNTGSQLNGIFSASTFNCTIKNNVIKNFNRIAVANNYLIYSGIRLSKPTGTTSYIISDNEIYNLGSSTASGANTIVGMSINHNVATSSSIIERNRVHSLQTINPSCELVGIYITTGSHNVINNIIRLGINPDGTAVGVPALITGIFEAANTVSNYYNNTVYIGGAVTGTGSSRCYFTNKVVANGIFRNNIFQNTRSNSIAGGHHTVFTTSANVAINTDNNLYHTPGTDGKIAFIVATSRFTLDAWRNSNLRDAGSLYGLPNLLNPDGDTSNFSLNINPALVSPAEGSGIYAGNVTNDILGQTRSSLTPHDMGAYAGNFMGADFVAPEINFTDLSNDVVMSSRTFSNVTITDLNGVKSTPGLKPRLYFKKSTDANNESGWKFVEANNNTSPFNFTIDYSLLNASSVQANDIIQYFVIASDTIPGPNVGKKDAIFAISPPNVVLSASHFPISGTLKSYTIKADIMGTKTVCTSGCDFNSLTNAGGAFEFINNNIVVGNVQLNITSDLATETGSVALNEFSSSFTLTIRPSGGPRVITNTTINNFITLNGADNVIIDGSLANTNNTLCPLSKASRDLTIKNSHINFNNSVIIIQNTTNNPAINNIVRNCNVEGNSTSKTTFGISSVSYTDFGTNQNNSNQYVNNLITKVQVGIYSLGQSINNKNEGTLISLNDINLTAPENLNVAGIYVGFENNANIIGNNISNVNSVTGSVSGIALGIIPSNTVTDFTGEEVTNTLISDNKINDITIQGDGSAYGITIASVISNGNSMNEFRNNLLYNIKTTIATTNDFIAGILVGGGGSGITKIFHNTIRLTGVASFSAPSFCLVIGGNNPQLNVKNNIFVNEMTSALGKNYAVGFTYDNSFSGLLSNRNNFYTSLSPFAVKGGLDNTPIGDLINFAAYKTTTGKDANSKNILPVFVSVTDLHLTQDPLNLTNLDAKGEPVGILTDMDCDNRSLTTPDIGSDEIIGCNFPVITLVSADVNPIPCSGNTTNLTVSGSLNGATEWKWYSSTCGGTLIGNGAVIPVMPQANTTYFVRGEGGCATEANCESINITISGAIVTNTNDAGPGSMRAAIVCAGNGDLLTFDPAVLGVNDTITINSGMLDLNKTISINQTASTIIKIKPTGSFPIFNIQPGNTLNLNYVDMFLNPNSQNTTGRAIFNSGNLQLSNVNIRERAQNIGGSGSTIQNTTSAQMSINANSQITIQN